MAELLGVGTAETVRRWIWQAEVDAGVRVGTSSEESAEPRGLPLESAELKRATAIEGSCIGLLRGRARPTFPLIAEFYDEPRQRPGDDAGTEMRRLRAEIHRRMLGNGYCTRPVDFDCHFESICESCSFFGITIEFRPTLQAQRDDAATKGHVGRQRSSTAWTT